MIPSRFLIALWVLIAWAWVAQLVAGWPRSSIRWPQPYTRDLSLHSQPMIYPVLNTPDDRPQDWTAVATFAAWCFRCTESYFQEYEGVLDAVVWYAWWTQEDAIYDRVWTWRTDHREATQVTYDPDRVSYKELVELLFKTIDPTDPEGQYVDKWFHYTTAIYYHNDEQRAIAQQVKDELDASWTYDKPIVTSIEPFETFYLAEEYHQDYYLKSSERYQRYKNGSGRTYKPE